MRVKIMNLIKDTLESRITKTKQKIAEYKDDSLNLSKYSEFDPQDIINSIYKTEERSLLDTFIKNKSKAERCISKPFEPKTNFNDSSWSSNVSFRSNHSSRSNNSSVNWSKKILIIDIKALQDQNTVIITKIILKLIIPILIIIDIKHITTIIIIIIETTFPRSIITQLTIIIEISIIIIAQIKINLIITLIYTEHGLMLKVLENSRYPFNYR